MNKSIFLDRDGIINKDINLLYQKKKVVILPKVKKTLKTLKDMGFLLIVVTNQPTVARGLITEKGVEELNKYVNSKIDNLVDKFYFCPHHPNADVLKYRKMCDCRKPSPELIFRAAKEFNIELKKSWMIGDMYSDIVAGKNVGCKTILVKSPKNPTIIKGWKGYKVKKPDYKVNDISEILNIIK